MIWLSLALLALLGMWIGAGWLLLVSGSRRLGTDYRRSVAKRVYAVGEEMEVELRLVAPANMQLADDHDVLLVIDHSGSMGSGPGSPLREAVRAAENFIRRLPDNIHAGVMGFDHEARLLAPITDRPRQAQRAVGTLDSGGGTAIHAALESSRDAFRAGRPGVKKTIILLSDGSSEPEPAELAAAKLRREIERLTIISVGFGSGVSESLLRTIAIDRDKYLHVSNPEDLHGLFSFLAASVSGQMAVAGLIDEGARAPHPFRLTRTGGLYPIGVQPPAAAAVDATRIVWSIPLMNAEPVPLTYNLVAECPGWHAVASADSKSTWRMPDGTKRELRGPAGPRVLIMPRWLGWAWPILNPLFWMLFSRFWPCPAKAAESVSEPELEPLPVAALPALPPPPQDRVYEPSVRPAVVIGLGEVGEWAVCRLKDRLKDRNVAPGLVETMAIHVTHRANREPVRIGNTALDAQEQIELHQDLRPYLETLRDHGAPPLRRWLPWQRWLAEMPPLTTLRSVAGDRRKARLAIIRKPEPVEAKLEAGLRRIVESDDGVVFVVGSIADADCSGLLAEVAHICAARGASVTALFAPTSFFETPATDQLALALELERMSLMSGEQIISDRHDPPVAARQLFDRIVVIQEKHETSLEASLPVAELLWSMLAYEGVFKQFPLLRPEGEEVICSEATIASCKLPALSLWNWVRERTLALGVNGRRLGLVEEAERLTLPQSDRQAVNVDVDAFWTGQYCARPLSSLLQSLRPALHAVNSDSISALLLLQEVVPFDQPYHEQVAYSRRERQAFAGFIEEWCQQILNREQEKNVWGVQILSAALLRIADDVQLVINRIKRLSCNQDFANLISFVGPLLLDSLSIITNLQSDLARWIGKLAGPQLELRIVPQADGIIPVASDIENQRQSTEQVLAALDPRECELLNKWFQDWYDTYGDPLLDQLCFRAVRGTEGQRVSIKLLFPDQELDANSDLAATLRAALDQYQNIVLGWPIQEILKGEELADPPGWFRVGKHSALAYPAVDRVADKEDPFVATAIQVRERSLKQALGVIPPPPGEVPYVWPEEANAARIAEKIRNQLRREPQPFSPLIVHLMRDTQKLHGFMKDLAQGRVTAQNTRYVLQRGAQNYEVGPTDERLKGMDAFQSVVQQVVAYERSLDGQAIPPPAQTNSAKSFAESMSAIETHPLGRLAVNSPDWKMWQDVVHGLMLEHHE